MLAQFNSDDFNFPIIGFIGLSGSGKTTLLKKLIPIFKAKGLKLGLIKHTHHRIIFDNKGVTQKALAKHSDVLIQTNHQSALELHQKEEETALIDAINDYQHLDIDLLLIEGFKHLPHPKIEIYRSHNANELLYHPNRDDILAIASDKKDLGNLQVPILDLNSPNQISEWILAHIVK